MPLIRNYEYYDHIDEFARKNGSMTTIPTRYVRNGKARIDEGDWRVSMNSTIHDPTDFDDLIDSNSNEMHNCSMFVEETRKKKRWKDLLFSKGKRSSRKEKKENIEPNHIHIINRSLSSVSFRNDPQYLKYYKPKRGESVSLSRNRYQTQPSMNLIIPNQYHHRNYKKTSIGYSDIGSPSSSHTSPDYDNSNLPQPSYVIYPASSLIPSRNYMIPSVNPSVQGKQRIFRSATYNDAFVNSQEWTMSRTISEMRLGIVGTAQSGKTSLVHRYLTGSYTSEDSPEGGRFKKEVVIEGQSHLLLIRDEGQQHLDVQFCQWVDAVVFVFSVCSKNSFDSIKSLAHEMNKYRNISDLPLLLVGTKDNISEKKARVIAEEEGRQMAASMKKCIYYETSSTHGTNVERVFKDACCKIIQQRIRTQLGVVTSQARTPTPTHQDNRKDYQDPRHMSATIFAAPSTVRQSAGGGYSTNSSSSRRSGVFHHRDPGSSTIRSGSERSMSAMLNTGPYGTSYRSNCGTISPSSSQKSIPSLSIMNGVGSGGHSRSSAALLDNDNISGQHLNTYSIDSMSGTPTTPTSQGLAHTGSQVSASTSHLPTPSSTPNTQRKNRRISNIFQRPKDNQEEKTKAIEALNLGVGRAIPVKQGLLYKKSTKSALNREWKKKYVCLYSDGRLAYHQNLKDYMDKTAHGKEVFLGLATVKVSGRQRPRNTQRTIGATNTSSGGGASENNGTPTLKNYESRKSDVGVIISGDGTSGGASDDAIKENQRNTIHFTPPAQPMTVAGKQKKRDTHRRIGSSGKHNDEDDECFEIVTHNQQRWEFCAASTEERDEWVSAIEEQIELALTAQMSQPTSRATANKAQVQAIRLIDGNDRCADCETLNPDWASLNLGTLICIECSGIHRNLGTHVSKVRSLELDGWPLEYLAVMQSIGNEIANRMWEFNIGREKKPTSESSREEKEWWIDRKYKQKAFLEPLRKDESIGAQLVGAVLARDVAKTSLLLANGITTKDVNAPVSVKDRRTVLHLACSIGSLEIVQLLLWNNADIRALDENGRSCLWYAQNNGFLECVEVLITAGLSPDYGCPKSNGIGGGGSYQNHTTMISCGESGNELPEGAIIGSMANRDYSCIGDEVYGRRGGAPPPIARRNIAHKQQSAAPSEIDLMPASMI